MKKLSGGKTAAVAAVAGGALLASIAPVMADVSRESPPTSLIRIESPAKLKAWGAAAEVQVTYACQPNQFTAYLVVNLSQNVLGRIASGSATKPVGCTGGFVTTTITVQAQNLAFWPLDAFAKADLHTNTVFPATDERVIRLSY